MKHHFSRHRPPDPPTKGVRLRDRDIAILDCVRVHRYVRAEHVHALIFEARTLRAAQRRLRDLWTHGYLIRYYLPRILTNGSPAPSASQVPIYTLTPLGAELLSERLGIPRAEVPNGLRHTPRGFPTVQHHLLVTDFMTALRLACHARSDLHLEAIEHEHVLWRRLADARCELKHDGVIVPDGAFTLVFATGGRVTFYLEIVRAGVKGGNKGLVAKMNLYTKLARRGIFRAIYGHRRVRAVLFATSSLPRAEGFRRLAERLKHGKRVFWFGAYRTTGASELASVFTPETVLTYPWHTAEGKSASLNDVMNEPV